MSIRALYGITVDHLSAAEDASYEIVSAQRSLHAAAFLDGPHRWDVLLREKAGAGSITRRFAHGFENSFHLFDSFDGVKKAYPKSPHLKDADYLHIVEKAFLEFSEKRRLLRECGLYKEPT